MTSVYVKSSLKDTFYLAVFPCIILLFSFMLNVSGRFLSALAVGINHDTTYYLSPELSYGLMLVYLILTVGIMVLPKLLHENRLSNLIIKAMVAGSLLSMVGAFYSDMYYLYKILQLTGDYESYSQTIAIYLSKEAWFYRTLFFLMIICTSLHLFLYKRQFQKISPQWIKFALTAGTIFMPFIVVYPLPIMGLCLFYQSTSKAFIGLPLGLLFIQHSFYALSTTALLILAYRWRHSYQLTLAWLKKLSHIAAAGVAITIVFHLWLAFIPAKVLAERVNHTPGETILLAAHYLKENMLLLMPVLLLLLVAGIFRQQVKKQQFNELAETKDTSGSFGTAAWATVKDLEKLNAFAPTNGISIGAIDE